MHSNSEDSLDPLGDESATYSLDSLGKLKVTELKQLLGERELPTTGKKDELVHRLYESYQQQAKTQPESASRQPELSIDQLPIPTAEDLGLPTSQPSAKPAPKRMKAEEAMVAKLPSYADLPVESEEPFHPQLEGAITVPGKAIGSLQIENEHEFLERVRERQKRFGVVTESSLLAKIEQEERIRMRKEKFK